MYACVIWFLVNQRRFNPKNPSAPNSPVYVRLILALAGTMMKSTSVSPVTTPDECFTSLIFPDE
jgi:hypothetical protein